MRKAFSDIEGFKDMDGSDLTLRKYCTRFDYDFANLGRDLDAIQLRCQDNKTLLRALLGLNDREFAVFEQDRSFFSRLVILEINHHEIVGAARAARKDGYVFTRYSKGAEALCQSGVGNITLGTVTGSEPISAEEDVMLALCKRFYQHLQDNTMTPSEWLACGGILTDEIQAFLKANNIA